MQDFVRLLAACLTPLIAVVATYIAYQQHRANKLKLRHDLFERRIEIYNAIAEFVSVVQQTGNADQKSLQVFLRKTRDGEFLFGRKASTYVGKLYRQGLTLQTCQTLLPQRRTDEQRDEEVRRRDDLFGWFSQQHEIVRNTLGDQLSLVDDPPMTGRIRLGIVSSIFWVAITTGLYTFGAYAAPRTVAVWFEHFYQWRFGHFGSGPMIDWPSFISLVILPVVFPWAAFLVVRMIQWVRAGFRHELA